MMGRSENRRKMKLLLLTSTLLAYVYCLRPDEAENVHVGLENGSHVDMNIALAILYSS